MPQRTSPVKRTIELDYDRKSFLEDLAAEVWSGHACTPTDLTGIIERAGISMDFDYYGDAFDGLIEHQNGRFHIYCNLAKCSGDPNSGRARFTLAHELGHYFIDEHRSALESGSAPAHAYNADRPSELRIEREADHFASALLMPSAAFKQELKAGRHGLQGILDISSTFRVSRQSAARRYVSLSGVPCAIVVLRNGDTPWWNTSPEMEARGMSGGIRKEAVVRGSATAQAQMSDDNSRIFESTTTASYWFWSVTHGTAKDIVLREQAIKLGGLGVLSYLQAVDERTVAYPQRLRG